MKARTRRFAPRRVRAPELVAKAIEVSLDEFFPDDPLFNHLQATGIPLDLEKLKWQSPAVDALLAGGVRLAVPFLSQGEIVGLLTLGARLSGQEYSSDDRKLLGGLASQVAHPLRVAQLSDERKDEAVARERISNELRVATLVQQHLLPSQMPVVQGWKVQSMYRPAREMGGDFYDFMEIEGGLLGIAIGDVTDKGVPAAMVMSMTGALLKAAATRLVNPGEVLERVNDQICPRMPAKMFVTCFYGVLDPSTGSFKFANAGHNVPYRARSDSVDELKACGMPLGLMPGMTYQEREVQLGPGDVVLFTTDGLCEAHSNSGEMFGCPRLMDLSQRKLSPSQYLSELLAFTGEGHEQEDDITVVTLECTDNRPLCSFDLASDLGNEREAMSKVVEAIAGIEIDVIRKDKLSTAVAEATMNAIEHGNCQRTEIPVHIEVFADEAQLRVLITDQGGAVPVPKADVPDLDKKLAGEQTPRGWGLFLIKNMVDEMKVHTDGTLHTIELVVNL